MALGDSPAAGRIVTDAPIEIAYRHTRPVAASGACWIVVLNEGESDERVPRWAAETVGGDGCVLLSPRGVGPTGRTVRKPWYFRRALALIGQTLDSGRVWDVLAFVRAADRPKAAWKVLGRGRAGVIAAYAALFEKKIREVVCIDPPASHDSGPHLLGVMRTLDIPDALGLLAPRPLTVRRTAAKAFDRTAAYYRAARAERAFRRR